MTARIAEKLHCEGQQLPMCSEPLGAVPDRAFGQLHVAWQKFLTAMEPQDAIWTFSAHRTTKWGARG